MQDNWQQRLRAAYADATRGKPHRSIKLPSGINFVGEGKDVQLSLSPECVTANMQSNAAAFEGWCLALRRWCMVENIVLQWTPPPQDAPLSERRHYQRFLYRAARFESLFEWFRIAADCALAAADARALERRKLFLNVGGDRVEQKGSGSKKPESALEYRLLESSDFAAHYGFAHGTRDRHLPVGLFSDDPPTKDSQIFPGGQASIDLVCLNDDTLWLFELKAEKNIPVGTVTELFFYTSVIRDALRGGPFTFAQARREAPIQPEALRRVKRIEGVMLGHNVHPLLDSGLISIMNEAVNRRWNADPSRAHVGFRADRISEKDERIIATVD